MTDINIEYAHIYTDQEASDEQRLSVEATLRYLRGLPERTSTVLTVMVVEYHPKHSNLLLTSYIDFLEDMNLRPHYVVMEGDLRVHAYKVLYSLPRRMRRDLSRRISSKESFPCSLLTATWYLYRLGCFGNHVPTLQIGIPTPEFFAKRIVTVLPEFYQANENRALEIIEASAWKNWRPCIEYVWFLAHGGRAQI